MQQRVRSPRYPSFSLREAEEYARAIFSRDGMNALDREAAVSHMGYSSLNGASAAALATLKQYGLTADAGKGMVSLTSLALDVIEPESERARAEALHTAAFLPALFGSLRDRFPDTVPSEANLRAHLLRQNFTQAAIKSVVPAYLETCEYIGSSAGYESHRHGHRRTQESADLNPDEDMPMTPAAPQPTAPPPSPSATTTPGTRRMVFDTEEGEATFTYPHGLSVETVEELEEWLKLVTKRLRRAAGKPSDDQTDDFS